MPHTQPTWSIGKIDHDKQYVEIDAMNGDETLGHDRWRGMIRVYGCVDDRDKGSEVMMANARLVTAGPVLYEALEKMLEEFNEQMTGIVHDEMMVVMKARAALAKARGEQ